jgi:hypothetical protein
MIRAINIVNKITTPVNFDKAANEAEAPSNAKIILSLVLQYLNGPVQIRG